MASKHNKRENSGHNTLRKFQTTQCRHNYTKRPRLSFIDEPARKNHRIVHVPCLFGHWKRQINSYRISDEQTGDTPREYL